MLAMTSTSRARTTSSLKCWPWHPQLEKQQLQNLTPCLSSCLLARFLVLSSPTWQTRNRQLHHDICPANMDDGSNRNNRETCFCFADLTRLLTTTPILVSPLVLDRSHPCPPVSIISIMAKYKDGRGRLTSGNVFQHHRSHGFRHYEEQVRQAQWLLPAHVLKSGHWQGILEDVPR